MTPIMVEMEAAANPTAKETRPAVERAAPDVSPYPISAEKVSRAGSLKLVWQAEGSIVVACNQGSANAHQKNNRKQETIQLRPADGVENAAMPAQLETENDSASDGVV